MASAAVASQPLEYFDALMHASAGGGCTAGWRAPESPCRPSLAEVHGRRHRMASIVSFGGSMTAGDPLHIGRACAEGPPGSPCRSYTGQPYPVLVARQLVSQGYAPSAFVRNLAEGALHGAAVPALCADTLLSQDSTDVGLSCQDLHCLNGRWGSGPERNWIVNATHVQQTRDPPPPALYDQAVDVALLEFSINGIEYVDVLLRRLRAKFPRALLLYVDQ